MARGLLSAIVFIALCASAQANPTPAARTTAMKAHNYWLSEGLNRLVFWKPPTTGQVQVIRH